MSIADPPDESDGLVGDGPAETKHRPGSARAALAHKTFRQVYVGAFASNIGSWMQNVVLAAYAKELTDSAVFVGVIIFAQLGPMLLFSPLGGLMADAFDRRKLLIAAQIEQMVMSIALAALTWRGDPSEAALVAVVFAIGIGQAINAPAWSAMIPTLVGRRDLPGAISLNSTQMNGSRVVGPVIGGLLFPVFGPGGVFAVNAVTYLAVIGTLAFIRLPHIDTVSMRGQGFRQLGAGLVIARQRPLIRRALVLLATFSLICLTFVGQMPVVAEDNYGFEVRSFAYGVLYALFGLGAMLGSISLGTVWSHRRKADMVRVSLRAYAVLLCAFALFTDPAIAFPLAFAVGFAYFVFITSLSTVIQDPLADHERGRVMALWIMGFGGTVPIGNLIAGPIIEATSITAVMLVGAGFAVVLSFFADLRRLGSEV